MALTYGFYNSINHDRRYNATQLSQLFDGIIADGVFANIGTAMVVTAGVGLTVTVGVGRAWFNGTWTLNDAVYPIEATTSDILRDRIDAVVLEVDQRETTRANRIFIKEGVASTTPQKPTMEKTGGVYQYPLCYITRAAGSAEITQADIENCVGTSECPFVTGVLSTISTDELTKQWNAQFDEMFEQLVNAVEQTLAGQLVDSSVTMDKLASDVKSEINEKLTTFVTPTGAKTLSFTVRGAGSASSNAWRRQMLNIQAWSQGADFANIQLMVDLVNGAPYGGAPCFVTMNRNLDVVSVIYSTVENDTTYTITFKADAMWALGYVVYKDGQGMSVINASDITEGTSVAIDEIASGGGMELLWSNASPTSDFGEQTLKIDLSEYTHFMIVPTGAAPPVIGYRGNYYYIHSFTLAVTENNSTVVQLYERKVTSTMSELIFTKCSKTMYTITNNKFNAISTDNAYCKPRQIYGIRGLDV